MAGNHMVPGPGFPGFLSPICVFCRVETPFGFTVLFFGANECK